IIYLPIQNHLCPGMGLGTCSIVSSTSHGLSLDAGSAQEVHVGLAVSGTHTPSIYQRTVQVLIAAVAAALIYNVITQPVMQAQGSLIVSRSFRNGSQRLGCRLLHLFPSGSQI